MRQTVGVILEAIYYDVVRTSYARCTRVVRQHLRSRCCYTKGVESREVGENAFDYGFLIGHEDMIGDLKADIFITFAHRSIQEFFGAFFFVLQLIEGKEMNTLLHNSHKKPILMMNPLFLHFCFWFLSDKCNEQYFILGNKEDACKMLHSYIYERINCRQVNIREIART